MRENKTIEIYRGDTNEIVFALEDGKTPVSARFAMREKVDGPLYFQVDSAEDTSRWDLPNGILRLKPGDTASMIPGRYVYDLEVTYLDGTVFSPIYGYAVVIGDVVTTAGQAVPPEGFHYVTAVQRQALDAAASPSASNPIATVQDVTNATSGQAKDTIYIRVFWPGEAVAVGDGAEQFVIPARIGGWKVTSIRANVYTAASAGDTSVTVQNLGQTPNGTPIALATPCVVAATQYSGTITPPTPPTISAGDYLRIDVASAGTGVAGLDVIIEVQEP